MVFIKVDFHTQFSHTIHILTFLYRYNSLIKNRGSFLHIKTSLNDNTFSGISQVYPKKNLGFFGM
jgi:hypothetical protein